MGKKSRRKRSAAKSTQAPTGRFAGHRPVLERVLFGVALLGVLITAHMNIWWAHYDAAAAGAAGSECGLPGMEGSSSFDCAAAFSSEMGTFLGLSNAVWGLLFFLVVAGLTVGVALASQTRSVLLKRLRAGFIGGGFLYALFLTGYQFFVLPQTCLLCLFSATTVAVLFVVQALYLFQDAPERAPVGTPMARLRLYGGLAVVLLVLVGADFVYFNGQEPALVATEEPAVELRDIDEEALCRFDETKPVFTNFEKLVYEHDAFKGRADAPVTIVEYFDPNCPHCKNIYPTMQAVAQLHPEEVKIVYKPVAVMGTRSVAQVAALHAAAEAGNEAFFGMLDRQFEHQDAQGLSMEQLRDFAEEVGMDDAEMARRIRDGAFRDAMRRESQIFRGLGMTGVPAVILEGKTVPSRSRSVECLHYFIERELNEHAAEEMPVETAAGEATSG